MGHCSRSELNRPPQLAGTGCSVAAVNWKSAALFVFHIPRTCSLLRCRGSLPRLRSLSQPYLNCGGLADPAFLRSRPKWEKEYTSCKNAGAGPACGENCFLGRKSSVLRAQVGACDRAQKRMSSSRAPILLPLFPTDSRQFCAAATPAGTK